MRNTVVNLTKKNLKSLSKIEGKHSSVTKGIRFRTQFFFNVLLVCQCSNFMLNRGYAKIGQY